MTTKLTLARTEIGSDLVLFIIELWSIVTLWNLILL